MDMVSGVSNQDRYLGFGVHLGTGISFEIAHGVYLGVEGKYFRTVADAKKDTDASLNPDIEGFLVTGNIGAGF